jgi:acetyl esterase/lipase
MPSSIHFLRVLFLCTSAACAGAAQDTQRIQLDVKYRSVDDQELSLDLYRPATKGPHPVAVGFHGGSWHGGDRKDPYMVKMCVALNELGIACASVQYRLVPKGRHLAPVEDARQSVQFLRANAERFGLDGKRVLAFGMSAGAHLACMLGAESDQCIPDSDDPLLRQSTRPQLVLSFAAPLDLADEKARVPALHRFIVMNYLGIKSLNSETIEHAKKVSPYHVLAPAAPPFILLHGKADTIVPFEQSTRMAKLLDEKGVPVLHRSFEGDHGTFLGEFLNGVTTSDLQAWIDAVGFIRKHILEPAPK